MAPCHVLLGLLSVVNRCSTRLAYQKQMLLVFHKQLMPERRGKCQARSRAHAGMPILHRQPQMLVDLQTERCCLRRIAALTFPQNRLLHRRHPSRLPQSPLPVPSPFLALLVHFSALAYAGSWGIALPTKSSVEPDG